MSTMGYWVKTGYLSLMSSFFLGPGTDAMNQYLADAIRLNDAETVDILTRLGATPDKKTITDAVQSGSIQILKNLCASNDHIKDKIVSEIQSRGEVELLKDLNLATNAKPQTPPASTQSMFKPASESQISKHSKQDLSENDDNKPII